jgi:hypothetical protein
MELVYGRKKKFFDFRVNIPTPFPESGSSVSKFLIFQNIGQKIFALNKNFWAKHKGRY